MNVLVTGGAGYIGSHACKRIAQSGDTPVVLDNFSQGHECAVRWGPVIRNDLSDVSSIRRALRDHQIGAVMHFAAKTSVSESISDPRVHYRDNVTGSMNLLDAMVDVGVRDIVFSSSCAVYGWPSKIPIAERHPQHPLSPYGETKLAIERALHGYSQAYGFSFVGLRYFNAAGSDPDSELGESHHPETHLIPLTIDAALNGTELAIYGKTYPTPDGTPVRDYVHVVDIAEAHWLALQHLKSSRSSVFVNLGIGRGYSVREVIAAVEKVTERTVTTFDGLRRPGDAPELVADARRAHVILGWEPKYPTLETMIEHALAWRVREARQS